MEVMSSQKMTEFDDFNFTQWPQRRVGVTSMCPHSDLNVTSQWPQRPHNDLNDLNEMSLQKMTEFDDFNLLNDLNEE